MQIRQGRRTTISMIILSGVVCAGMAFAQGEKSQKPIQGASPAPPPPGTPLAAHAPAYEAKAKEFSLKASKAQEEGKEDEGKAYQAISLACGNLADAMKKNDRQAHLEAAKMLSTALNDLKKCGVKLEGFLGGPQLGAGAPGAKPAEAKTSETATPAETEKAKQ